MSQTVVTEYFSTRKRVRGPAKSIKSIEKRNASQTLDQLLKEPCTTATDVKITAVRSKNVQGGKTKQLSTAKNIGKIAQPKAKTTNHKEEDKLLPSASVESDRPRTPKRNLSNPDELTPSKKKPLFVEDQKQAPQNIDLGGPSTETPKKRPYVRRKLNLVSQKNEDKNFEKGQSDLSDKNGQNIELKTAERAKDSETKTADLSNPDELISKKKPLLIEDQKQVPQNIDLQDPPSIEIPKKRTYVRKKEKLVPQKNEGRKKVEEAQPEFSEKNAQNLELKVPELAKDSKTKNLDLSNPDELTLSKKKPLLIEDQKQAPQNIDLQDTPSIEIPKKRTYVRRKEKLVSQKNEGRNVKVQPVSEKNARNLELKTPKLAEDTKTKNLASLINESRSKILFSNRLDELKKSLEKFEHVSKVAKDFQSNSFKITSVVSSAKQSSSKNIPSPAKVPAYQKYSYLAASESSSLLLPYKYKLLSEAFRCMDTVVSMLNNRKEKITFEKVKEGVQKMTGRNFSTHHLGQIITILPSAYSMHYEKCDAYFIQKKSDPSYSQLMIFPNLSENTDKPSGEEGCIFVHMSPQDLIQRRNAFVSSLIKEVKRHHQKFLAKLKFPALSDNEILRWHPKFPLDSVPDIQAATLPQVPEMKVCSAKDVLNKIHGQFRGKMAKALAYVSESKTSTNSIEDKMEDVKEVAPNVKKESALKGICSDLLEKIRAKESAKLLENMTRSPDQEKRSAMLEHVPKIVHILWHFFIAERKFAVPVDIAVEKIIHSFNTLTTPDEVKEHLQLINEIFPKWLSFIKIPKGVYITMDKTEDINEMLKKLK